ncbi:hypothetical protein, partial [Micromonospora sp. NPDC005652]|uniref:hypothetical protein n=1 Tax=Micromonospora sp. NPDC005652 TaxID=3157046 RepID=UPI0033E7895D
SGYFFGAATDDFLPHGHQTMVKKLHESGGGSTPPPIPPCVLKSLAAGLTGGQLCRTPWLLDVNARPDKTDSNRPLSEQMVAGNRQIGNNPNNLPAPRVQSDGNGESAPSFSGDSGLPAQGQLQDACFSGGLLRADGSRSAGIWQGDCTPPVAGSDAQSEYDPEFPTIKLENYRGRFNAWLAKNGYMRLPLDWDAHHAIPQEYRSHPEFAGFDFDAPSNVRGLPGSRMKSRGANVHQDITNQWKWFKDLNPNPTRTQIESVAAQIDRGYGAYFWREPKPLGR